MNEEHVLVHPELPLESLLTTREHAFQRAFAFEALRRLGEPPFGAAYRPDHEGLRMYFRDESVFDLVAHAVPEFQGSVDIQPPSIRYRMNRQLEEPMMDLHISVPKAWVRLVRGELTRRQTMTIRISLTNDPCVLRGNGPLRQLMGFDAWLREITGREAQLTMWLSHYRAVCHDPDPQAA